MRYKFSINNKNYFELAGRLTVAHMKNRIDAEEIKEKIIDLNKEAKDIKKVIITSLADDRKITDEERLNVIKEIDDFINSILSIRFSIGNHMNIEYEAGILANARLLISINKSPYNEKEKQVQISGFLLNQHSCSNKDYTAWINEIFAPCLIELLTLINNCFADDIITEEEKKSILSQIDEIIYHVIIMRYILEYCIK